MLKESSLLRRPVLRIECPDKRMMLDPRTLEGYKPGDTIALIYGDDLKYLLDIMLDLLSEYKELAEVLERARRAR